MKVYSFIGPYSPPGLEPLRTLTQAISSSPGLGRPMRLPNQIQSLIRWTYHLTCPRLGICLRNSFHPGINDTPAERPMRQA